MLALLATLGPLGPVSAAASADEPAADSQTLLNRAAAQLAGTPSLEARFRQRVQLFGQELSGAGSYLQKRSPQGLLLRLELKLQVGSQLSSLQQVADGRFLWIRRDLPGGTSLGRVDLERLRAALPQRGQPARPEVTTDWLARGGLPGLIAALAEHFQFSPPQAVRSDQAAMWVLEGRWKAEKLASLPPEWKPQTAKVNPADPRQLPAHLPTEVRLVLGQSDLLPYRIEYRRQPAESAGDQNAAARPLVVLEITEFQQREDLDDRLFIYQPGNQEVADYTDRYLASLVPERPDERPSD